MFACCCPSRIGRRFSPMEQMKSHSLTHSLNLLTLDCITQTTEPTRGQTHKTEILYITVVLFISLFSPLTITSPHRLTISVDDVTPPRYTALQSPLPSPQPHDRLNIRANRSDEGYSASHTLLSNPSNEADYPELDSESPNCFQRCCASLCQLICRPRCAMCSVICCFGCLTCCGCRDRVCQRLVFFPPKPFYAVEEKTNAQGGTQQTLWLVEDGVRIEPYTSSNMKLAFVSTRRKSTICTLWLRYPAATTTVLFSHGNATDIGCMRDHVIDYARQLKVNVMIYDYTGYGLSAGLPAMSDTLADAEAAYDYLLSTYPNESQRIIVYGQSLGSGPTMHLASKRRVSGVVIHAGIMSALRVIQPNIEATKWFDIYPNIDVVKKVNATLFVMHGTDDKEIPIEHGRALSAAAPKPFKPWFVDGAGHNNIEVDFREAYFARLDAFVRYIEETTPLIDGMEQTDDEKKELVKKRQGGIEVKNPRHPSVIAAAATGSSASSSPPPKESIALKSQPKSSTASSSSSASSSSQSSSDPRSPKKSPRGASQPTRFDHI